MGLVFRHQHAAGTEWALRRQHLLGRSAQLLLLARPGEARHRRALHPGLALLRRAGRRALRRVRARPLCRARLSPRDRHQPAGEPPCTQSPESPARSAAPHENLLTQRTVMEPSLEEIGLPVTFLRPGWFMENALWDVPSARDEGVLRSFLQPADKLFPMVATRDVGRLAAALLREDWVGTRVVELEGAARISPNDLARAFATVLKRPVRVETVPREDWELIFRSQGTRNPLPRIRMLDGFNKG